MTRVALAAVLATGLLASAPHAATPISTVVGHIARADLVEASAMAASRVQPGVFWSLNDSGGEPIVYALDLNGRDLGAWRVLGATNNDWESLAVGPCQAGKPGDCLYVGETGDNAEARPFRTIYKIPEPKAPGQTAPAFLGASPRAQRLDYVYEDGPHDVEAMYVAADTTVWLVTKGRSKGVNAFRLPPEAWAARGKAVAHAIKALPIPVDVPTRTLVTDAGLSPDAGHVAIRTYKALYIFAADPVTGALKLSPPPSFCDLGPLGEAQGEGVGWHRSGKAQILSSEGIGGQISLIECPPPNAAANK